MDLEPGASTGLARHVDEAAVAAHDAGDDGQAQVRALAEHKEPLSIHRRPYDSPRALPGTLPMEVWSTIMHLHKYI